MTEPAALRSLKPGTGDIAWETALSAGPVMGSPSMNGAGVIAAATYSFVGPNKLFLVDASDGAKISVVDMTDAVFAQPAFAGDKLYVATTGNDLICYGLP